MIELKEAYKIAENCFLENKDYSGVEEVRETPDSWLFRGKLKQTTFGTFDINVPKNGIEPYVENPNENGYGGIWENAKRVNYNR